MTEKSIPRDALLESFGALEKQFTSSLKDAQKLEQAFEDARAELEHSISSHLQKAKKTLPKANPLQGPLNTFVKSMAQTSQEWDAKVAGRKKGVEFRQGFEDSLLVFVSGKVKSGKSSLGNYVAWGHTDPTDDIKRQTKIEQHPKYQSHARVDVEGGDSHKEAVKKREFRVGATEATSSIQSFSLPGLTWVDSPGLHSFKEENGKLAREYLEHADLILYTMKSDAPGRASDLEEIRSLIRKDKRTLLLLTGSDDVEEDISESGDLIQRVVMKDSVRRNKQQDYVHGELKELPDCGKLEIVSISTRYAQEHANDRDAFLDSGIGPFCATLRAICESDGVKMKQRVPMSNLQIFLESCESDLTPYKSLITDFKPVLVKLDEILQKQISKQTHDGQRDLTRFIDKFFDGLQSDRDDPERISGELRNFNSKLGKQFLKIANARLKGIADGLTEEFQSNVKSTYRHSLLTRIPDFKLDTVIEKVEDGTSSGTKKRNGGIGSIVGGGIGLWAGGPPGLAVGSMVGGWLGGATGDSASIRYRDVRISVGDNLQDIRRKLLDTHCDALDVLLQKSATNLWQEFDESIQSLLRQLLADIEQFQSDLEKIQRKTQAAL